MKRARIMLVAIAIMAIISGALAFKTSKKYADNYCILTTQPGLRTTCSTWLVNFKTTDPQFVGIRYYYTTTTSTLDCPKNVICTGTSALIVHE